MLALAPSTLVTLAVAVGATTPVPSGGAGSLIWSSTASAPLVWNGSQWAACATGSGSGDVVGPASATDNAVVRFDGTTGKLVQSCGVKVDDDGNMAFGGNAVTTGVGWRGVTCGGSGTSGQVFIVADDDTVCMSMLANASNPQLGVRRTGDATLDCYVAAWSGGNQLNSKSRDLEINVGSSLLTRIKVTTAGKVQIGTAPPTNGQVNVDGVIRAFTNSGANEAAVPLANWVMLSTDYTLASSTSEQKAFNTTTNGALTLPTGIYRFECFLYVTTMSTTSGNMAFDPIGAGTAIADRFGYNTVGIDNSTPLSAGTQTGSGSVTQQSPASAVTAATGTGTIQRHGGMFRVSTGGTIIPSVTLVTAAAAVVKAGSWFFIEKVGESTETNLGAWS